MSTAIFDFTRGRAARLFAAVLLILALAFVAHPVMAQPAAAPVADKSAAAGPDVARPLSPAVVGAIADDGATYTAMKPVQGVGMPITGGLDIQHQYSPTGRFAYKFHYAMLWVMGAISLFVLGLIVFVMWRFRASANPVPSRTTHNTLLEVVWTLVPVLILVGIAIPSISLLSQQYRTPPKNAITVKATGYQWYWGYTYPDNGGFEVISICSRSPMR